MIVWVFAALEGIVMAKPVRVNLDLPQPVADVLDELAERRGTTRTGVIRIALGVLHAADKGCEDGRSLILTRRRTGADTLVVAPL